MMEARTQEELYDALVALMPNGRAVQSEDLAYGIDQSVIRQFLNACALSLSTLDAAICAMGLEFFCDTTAADSDLWLDDYEDECGLAALDLCLKVHERNGGVSLAYYQSIATELGYTAAFYWLKNDHTAYPGVNATLLVNVDSAGSPALGDIPYGDFVLGVDALGGAGSLDVLQCILEHVLPAHVALIYNVV